MKDQKLTTENYKGTRDFYPEDMRIRNYLFSTMKRVVSSYGYEEYDGPMIESLDLYKAKTGEEIVGKQIYNFVDKGNREVAIRPEMTPTVARMVAGRLRELPRPIRWFSIPNLWRYEQPGHGRLREHWQLNVDLFGINSFRAELEILQICCDILFAFGAPRNSFQVKISHRKLLDSFFQKELGLDAKQSQEVSKILDKRNKITVDEYNSLVEKTIPSVQDAKTKIDQFLQLNLLSIDSTTCLSEEIKIEIKSLFDELQILGLADMIIFDPSIVRGFDYYTGFIFEIFDTNPKNKRSLYGGGRYDNLIGLFSKEELTGTGFGLGDVTLKDFLETHGLLNLGNQDIVVFIPFLEEKSYSLMNKISKTLRSNGWNVDQGLSSQKMNKQLSYAEKKGYPFVILLGQEELEKGKLILKNMETREQIELEESELQNQLSIWRNQLLEKAKKL